MCKEKKSIIAIIMLLPLLLCAITLYVDGDYISTTPGWGTTHFAEIQDAIDAFATGDVIFVYPGTYDEAITNYSNSVHRQITLRSNYTISGNWEDVENTVIDAYGQGFPVVSLSQLQTVEVEINGFTIKNGTTGIACIGPDLDLLNCIVEDNSNQGSGGGLNTRSNSNSTLFNCIFRDNESGNGGGIYSDNSTVNIDNSEFYSNEATGGKGGAICFNYENGACNSLSISRSIFYENTADDYGGAIYYPGCSSGTLPELEIDFTTFADNAVTTGNGAKGIDLGSDGHDNYKSALIENSIFSEASPNISTSTHNCDINYTCLKNGCDNPNADLSNCITSDPDFVSVANDDYHIKWGSPCIDEADPAADDDDDYSNADMGVYPYERDHFDMTRVTYRWICYPRLDVTDGVNNGESDDYLCPDAAMDAFWSTVPNGVDIFDQWNPETGDAVCEGVNDEDDLVWTPDLYEFFSYRGIKVQTDNQFYIGGYLMDPDYEFDDLTADADNWLGYFLEESQHVEDAIDSGFMDDLLEIRTQNWSMVRGTLQSRWTISVNYTFNYGDLVILKPGATIADFKWQQPSRDSIEPILRPQTEYFSYDDEVDYMNIIAEFSPEDMPQEVAIYVNDVCKGAQVVEDTLCQICAYILEEEPGSEIEFAFYDGERSIRSCKYLVLDNLTGNVTGSNLVTGTPGSYYYVSFKDGDALPPAIKYNLRVAPNPFNPSTAICFELDDESEISLNIYNIKGQLVRNLVNETYRPGEYQVVWDGHDSLGNVSSSGVYFYQMKCGSDVISGKMLMLK
jgi:FlgD Ig-like domain/Chlamydia polymorphic membrane protein (Chlamydia_PMP) repeat